jgi:hypothetical protein
VYVGQEDVFRGNEGLKLVFGHHRCLRQKVPLGKFWVFRIGSGEWCGMRYAFALMASVAYFVGWVRLSVDIFSVANP